MPEGSVEIIQNRKKFYKQILTREFCNFHFLAQSAFSVIIELGSNPQISVLHFCQFFFKRSLFCYNFVRGIS